MVEIDGSSYETLTSFEQNLTFDYCTSVFQDKGMRFGDYQKQTLKIVNADGLYTNLGLLLSDQCIHSIQFNCFQGTQTGQSIDSQKMTGSILKHLDDSLKAINFYNRTRPEIHGLGRPDAREYPDEAIREAVMNSIVHRDYGRDVSTNIRVYDNRIEIASHGGLPPNTTIDTFFLGLSMPRNRNLTGVFCRLGLMDAFGSGITKMSEMYQAYGRDIQFKTSSSGFLVILPSLSDLSSITLRENENEYQVRPNPQQHEDLDQLLQKQYDMARAFIHQKGPVKRQELEVLWKISRSSATNIINKLIQNELLIPIGKGRALHYALPRTNP